MRRPLPLAAFVAVAAVAVVGAGCGRRGQPTSGTVSMAGQAVTTGQLAWIASGVCDAAALAGHDPNSARATFYGQSHDGLHLIARGLQTVDRDQSAALLVAKQKVEADFEASPPPPQVTADLRQLAEVTRASLTRFHVSVPACPASAS
jgi:hypothetical protein